MNYMLSPTKFACVARDLMLNLPTCFEYSLQGEVAAFETLKEAMPFAQRYHRKVIDQDGKKMRATHPELKYFFAALYYPDRGARLTASILGLDDDVFLFSTFSGNSTKHGHQFLMDMVQIVLADTALHDEILKWQSLYYGATLDNPSPEFHRIRDEVEQPAADAILWQLLQEVNEKGSHLMPRDIQYAFTQKGIKEVVKRMGHRPKEQALVTQVINASLNELPPDLSSGYQNDGVSTGTFVDCALLAMHTADLHVKIFKAMSSLVTCVNISESIFKLATRRLQGVLAQLYPETKIGYNKCLQVLSKSLFSVSYEEAKMVDLPVASDEEISEMLILLLKDFEHFCFDKMTNMPVKLNDIKMSQLVRSIKKQSRLVNRLVQYCNYHREEEGSMFYGRRRAVVSSMVMLFRNDFVEGVFEKSFDAVQPLLHAEAFVSVAEDVSIKPVKRVFMAEVVNNLPWASNAEGERLREYSSKAMEMLDDTLYLPRLNLSVSREVYKLMVKN